MPKPGNTTDRGYGTAHQRERKRWAALLKHHGHLPCARCGEDIQHGEPWDLGHTPDRTGYIGPEHQHCNRVDGGKRRHGPITYHRRPL